MLFTTSQNIDQVIGAVEIVSPTGILILTIGILFTVGVTLIVILKGKKDYFYYKPLYG